MSLSVLRRILNIFWFKIILAWRHTCLDKRLLLWPTAQRYAVSKWDQCSAHLEACKGSRYTARGHCYSWAQDSKISCLWGSVQTVYEPWSTAGMAFNRKITFLVYLGLVFMCCCCSCCHNKKRALGLLTCAVLDEAFWQKNPVKHKPHKPQTFLFILIARRLPQLVVHVSVSFIMLLCFLSNRSNYCKFFFWIKESTSSILEAAYCITFRQSQTLPPARFVFL